MDVCREGQLAEPSSKIRDTVNHKIPQDKGSSTVDPSKIVPIKLATYGSDISGTATGEDYVDTTIQSKSHNHDVITKFINDDVISPVFSRISGGTRRKRIIDAVDDTNYIPEFTAGGMAEDSLFEDD
ncbi:hypothetical protein BBOV_I005025 [Babesia bovis T2Bo]|nr:hypothetical protein BBOV_I005025 [Babesia bovis T2Bo]KAG6440190.1 hypothetical protein BBOV_I005025 [Babesia bovis T2Bo]